MVPAVKLDIALRPVTPEDKAFLFDLYALTRAEELSAWGWSDQQRALFLQMQYQAQRLSYQTQYPESRHDIILLHDPLQETRSLGRIWVSRSNDEIRLLDITLLPDYRDRGIGTRLIQQLIDQAHQSDIPLRLHVLKTNPALHLYERLGGIKVADLEIRYLIEWRSLTAQDAGNVPCMGNHSPSQTPI
jgi:ribosomal protein S18 acetylase RimI-like enzyme